MVVTVQQRASRILDNMARFQRVGGLDGDIPTAIQHTGGIIGVYNYDQQKFSDTLWICEAGIWAFNGAWQLILFEQIKEVRFPESKTDDNDTLTLLLADGHSRVIPVVGRSGRCRDVYEFGRFLNRVTEDLRDELV